MSRPAMLVTMMALAAAGQTCVTTTTALSQAQVDAMTLEMNEAFATGMPVRGRVPVAAGDVAGGVVRLSFHDAAGFDIRAADTLGVDGCVNMANPDNAGLEDTIALLEELRQPHCDVISRADFWVLAAKAAVELTAGAGAFAIPFRWGRADAATCVFNGGSRLPAAEGDEAEIERVFVTQMGLTLDDAVALLGAHTLGRAQLINSGYEGPWVNDVQAFNNEYYDTLINDPWRRNPATVGGAVKTTWDGPGNTIMLNVDMEIAFDTGNNNVCGGRGNLCNTKDLAAMFARDNAAWLAAFASSFQSMTEVGYDGLQDPAAETLPPTAPPPATSEPTPPPPATSEPTPPPPATSEPTTPPPPTTEPTPPLATPPPTLPPSNIPPPPRPPPPPPPRGGGRGGQPPPRGGRGGGRPPRR